MKLSKLIFVAFALLAQIAQAAQTPAPSAAPVPGNLYYQIAFKNVDNGPSTLKTVGNSSFTLSTVVGKETGLSSITESVSVTEINSNLGAVTAATGVIKNGIEASVKPEEMTGNGQYTTTVKYVVWSSGLAVAKGTHVVNFKKGERVELTGFSTNRVFVTLLDK